MTSTMRSMLTMIAMAVSTTAVPLQAQAAKQLGIASFNMAWAGTEADFESHLAMCTAVAWCDTRPQRKEGERVASPGALEKARMCEAAMLREAGGADKVMRIAPCNAYRAIGAATVVTGADYGLKMAGLRSTVARLIEQEGVRVIAFQEVNSEAAVRAVLGQHAARFATCAAPHNAFQTVAFAWDKSVSARSGQCQARAELAVPENPREPSNLRSVRPGLALTLHVNGQPLTLMNVHLKASCANLQSSGRYAGRLLTDPDSNCRVLNRQVAALEAWVEAVDKVSPRFVLLGDFNRRIDEEMAAPVTTAAVRADGSDPAGPIARDEFGYVTSRYLWQEISDGKPNLYQVPLASAASECKGFVGLDHIVVSGALHHLPHNRALASRKMAVAGVPGQRIETSDHCPRLMQLGL